MADGDAIPGAAARLYHPSGGNVYLVGVAHISPESIRDAESVVRAVQPAYVVLEVDEERMKKLMEGDGMQPRTVHGILQSLRIVFTGQLLTYLLANAYTIAGGLLGSPPGGEMRAAAHAAEEVGASVILADRPQGVTMQRLARLAAPQQNPSLDEGTLAQTAPKPADEVMERVQERWESFLEDVGCSNPEAVTKAFKRIVAAGMRSEADIAPDDVCAVRQCGTIAVETLRRRANAGAADSVDRLEMETLKEIGKGGGFSNMNSAVQQVVGKERDLILARRLWEAGDHGEDVVGIVGAAHIKGIAEKWPEVGSPEGARLAEEYMQAPAPARVSSAAAVAMTGACFGLLAYRRPRLAAGVAAFGAAVSTPALVLATMTVSRWSRFAERIVDVSKQLDAEQGGGDAVLDFSTESL